MIMECPKCKKKFDLDSSLIPDEGRLLQCSSCQNKWFYKKSIIQTTEFTTQINESAQVNENTELPKETETIIKEAENNKIKEIIKNTPKVKVSFFNIFLLFIISSIALIILLDTFKVSINSYFPGFIFFLENFYLSLNDLLLIIKDLIRK